MKVILNKDLAPLGEEGDVKDVAKGYARNFLFPRGIALPYNEKTIKLFEGRQEEIEARKVQKRSDAAGIKEKLEALTLEITMPAGANGKLYGAVTNQTIMDELAKQGYQIERKRIELPASSIKNVGKYKIMIKLYESAAAELNINVLGQEIKTETKKPATARPVRKRRDEGDRPQAEDAQSGQAMESNNEAKTEDKTEVQAETAKPDSAAAEQAPAEEAAEPAGDSQ